MGGEQSCRRRSARDTLTCTREAAKTSAAAMSEGAEDYSADEASEKENEPEKPVVESRLISAGEELMRKMKSPNTDPQELSDIAKDAIARGEFAGMLAARDERGRTPLHVAATRGDLRLCREMMKTDPGIVNQIDKYKNTPVMEASLNGRQLIVKELIENAADVVAKNFDCMNALQLACVNEGAGNGQVVEDLIKAGADPSEMCWQTTPLMAAADSGHSWAVLGGGVQVQQRVRAARRDSQLLCDMSGTFHCEFKIQILIDMGADVWQMNGSSFTALDYARDMETAQALYDLMQGDRLSNKPAPRFDTQKLFKDAEARRAKLHKAAKTVPLEAAFAELEIPVEKLSAFRETGEHFNEIRKAWHRVCLRCHPDKQPEDLEEEKVAEWTAQFQNAVAAFEACERHYRSVCKEWRQLKFKM